MTKRKLTRAEANELSWALKKKKKRTGNASGSRSNPNAKAKEQAQATAQTEQSKPARAIPIFIPGRDKPLVNNKLQTVAQAKAEETAQATGQSQDLVIVNGELVAASTLQAQARAKARKQERAQAASNKDNKEGKEFDVSKLGKAQLRMLEKAGVEPGKEAEFFAQLAASKKARKEAKPQHAEKEDRRIKSRDYKAGRNTDYTATQAQAEKLLANKKKKKDKLSGDELLDLWENTQW
ncbi:hypothetical protein CJP74_06925 [Psittacicella melopsittaci]|uniref:Uncharacterized protein n=1 Tax=Psittacicella melopsittaci TaxID=2028576 RepID=A0A3A1Y003_9GAMM|nr:GTPase-activating protein [Psittacicella melopsittaci]RIY31583.1 hypothetical protein CJP74_06925 [Psittacicella melopsittaci]